MHRGDEARVLFTCLQDEQKSLPHLVEPHDTLRLGLRNLKDQASISHPVEAIQSQVRPPMGTGAFAGGTPAELTAVYVCSTPHSRSV